MDTTSNKSTMPGGVDGWVRARTFANAAGAKLSVDIPRD